MMDYLKFNCYDLAAQNTELHSASRKMRSLADEFSRLYASLDPQIKSYENLNTHLKAANETTADVAARILTASTALDQIIDVYYAAEKKALQGSTELPDGSEIARSGDSYRSQSTARVLTSSIHNEDLILEDWLAELVYKDERNR